MVAAQWAAPPSFRSSRSTQVMTVWRRPSSASMVATRSGSSGSAGSGAAGGDVAELARSGADAAQDHDGQRLPVPALADVGAGRARSEPGLNGRGSRISCRPVGDPLEGACHPSERCSEIGKVDQREQQAGHPKGMDVGEERQEAKHGDDLELQLVPLVRQALRKRMQLQEEVAEYEQYDDQYDRRNNQKDIGLAGRSNERREVMRGGRVKLPTHRAAPVEDGKTNLRAGRSDAMSSAVVSAPRVASELIERQLDKTRQAASIRLASPDPRQEPPEHLDRALSRAIKHRR